MVCLACATFVQVRVASIKQKLLESRLELTLLARTFRLSQVTCVFLGGVGGKSIKPLVVW